MVLVVVALNEVLTLLEDRHLHLDKEMLVVMVRWLAGLMLAVVGAALEQLEEPHLVALLEALVVLVCNHQFLERLLITLEAVAVVVIRQAHQEELVEVELAVGLLIQELLERLTLAVVVVATAVAVGKEKQVALVLSSSVIQIHTLLLPQPQVRRQSQLLVAIEFINGLHQVQLPSKEKKCRTLQKLKMELLRK